MPKFQIIIPSYSNFQINFLLSKSEIVIYLPIQRTLMYLIYHNMMEYKKNIIRYGNKFV